MTQNTRSKRHRPRVRSPHPSHKPLKPRGKELPTLNFRSTVRLGSVTPNHKINKGRSVVECNSVEAVKRSGDKKTMKQQFDLYGVRTPDWFASQVPEEQDMEYPILAKKRKSSRARGMRKLDSREEFREFLNNEDININDYIFEKFHNYGREYRLHVTKDGCFYTCRKMIKRDRPEDNRWFRNDSNCVWFLETNPKFNKPNNWDEIEEHCVKTLESVGLDIGAIDVKVSTQVDDQGNNPFVILETSSGPSFGNITIEKYKEKIPEILKQKYEDNILIR